MPKPLLLDLFCCAGGAAMGYHCAGFDVVGIDIVEQPRYPFEFIRGDAIAYAGNRRFLRRHRFAAVHASPPCQLFSVASKQDGYGRRRETIPHGDLVGATRDLLVRAGLPFVIENVVGAPVRRDLLLCGKIFDLDVARHRIFECWGFAARQPRHRPHTGRVLTVAGHSGGSSARDGDSRFGSVDDWRAAIGIDWMIGAELVEAIPPAYTAYIGLSLVKAIGGANA